MIWGQLVKVYTHQDGHDIVAVNSCLVSGLQELGVPCIVNIVLPFCIQYP